MICIKLRTYLRGKSSAFFFFFFFFLAAIINVDWGIEMICPAGAVEQSRAESPGLGPEVILHLASTGPEYPGEGERRPVLRRLSAAC